jgi:glycosyltransferase involved in cell wall biosynthesis
MKVLIIFTYGVSLDQWFNSGIIYREIELYKRLLQKEVKVSLLTYGDHKDFNYSDILDNINVYPILKYIKSRTFRLKKLKAYIMPLRLKSLFNGIDIIKTNQMEGSLIAVFAKLLYKKKLIVRCGWEWLRTYVSNYKIKEKKNYLKYLLRYIQMYLVEFIVYKLADGIILTNEDDLNYIIKKFGLNKKKINLFYNFIDIEKFKPLKLVKKDKSVLFIGRLSEEKNLFNLIKAFKHLDDFSLDIIGKGPLERKLRRVTKDLGVQVNFLGVFPNNKLPEIINQYPIYILPSFYEGNPKTLLEAMSCGLACIGTNVIGIKNLINHEENGLLCEKDPKSISNTILELHNNLDLQLKIGKNARTFIVENCSLQSITEKEYNLYQNLVN